MMTWRDSGPNRKLTQTIAVESQGGGGARERTLAPGRGVRIWRSKTLAATLVPLNIDATAGHRGRKRSRAPESRWGRRGCGRDAHSSLRPHLCAEIGIVVVVVELWRWC